MSYRRTARGKPRRARTNAGFALIEVLVAVGVASVLMAVLLRSFISTWSGVNIVREEAEGTMLARSILDEAMLRGKFAPGSQDGTLGRYAWNVTTTMQTVPTVAAIQPAPQPSQQQQGQQNQAKPAAPATVTIYQIVVTMRGPSGRTSRLDAFKTGAVPQ